MYKIQQYTIRGWSNVVGEDRNILIFASLTTANSEIKRRVKNSDYLMEDEFRIRNVENTRRIRFTHSDSILNYTPPTTPSLLTMEQLRNIWTTSSTTAIGF